VQIATLPTTVPTDVATIVRAHPDVKWVQANFDYLGGFAVQGLTQGGFKDVGVVSGDAVNQQLDQLRSGNHYRADIGASPTWVGWAAADMIMRVMLGQKITDEVVPQRVFTQANIPATDSPDALVSTNFESAYKQLWGLGS
jgi:ribose transport system substrate-binding protein